MSRVIRTSLLLIAVLALSCTSRYRLELYQTADDVRKKVKVEETRFVPGTVLAEPNAEERIRRGDGNTMVITTGTRGVTKTTGTYAVLRFDEYMRCDIFFGLDANLSPGAVDLKNNSYLWIKGRYDQPAASRLFLPETGSLVIDSLAGSKMFVTLNATYVNAEKTPLKFDGQFKIKIRD